MGVKMLRTLAVVMIMVGAAAMAPSQVAYSFAEADRGASLTIADDPNANLGIEDKSDVDPLRGDSTPQRVATLRNNVGQTLTIQDVVVDSINTTSASDLQVANPPDAFELASGDPVDVEVDCNSTVNAGPSNVTFRVTSADGSTVHISGVTWSVTVNIQCGKGNRGGGTTGPAQFVANNATAGNPDNTQTFQFNASALANRDYAYIDLSDAQGSGIDYNGSTVTEVGGNTNRQLFYDEANERIVYQKQGGGAPGNVTVEISGFTIDGNSGDQFTAYYSDDQGRSGSDDYRIE